VWRRLGITLIISGLLGPIGEAAAAGAEPDSIPAHEAAGESGWLTRTVHRYFGSGHSQGDELAGRSVEIVDRYTEYVGKPIEVVIINQVARFDRGRDGSHGTAQRLFDTAAEPFQTYTRDSTIRQYLLFAEGQVVDPFLIADTERLLRSLDFIEDVRIVVVPLMGEIESVAIVVETRDRWPFGAAGLVKDVGRYEVSLYSSNVAGIGLRFDNRLIYRDDREPNVGYEGSLRKRNFFGTFVAGKLEFEDSYRKNHLEMALTRELSHPSIKWVGGASWRRTRERDAGPDPDKQEVGDVWLGDVVQLQPRPAQGKTARPVVVPAVRFNRKTYLDRPTVSRDTLSQFHNSRNYLTGVTYQRFKYYKTSFLFDMGETENLPSGLILKLSGGYQDGEFHDRVRAHMESSYFATRNRGDVAFARFALGGFFRNGLYEDGSLIVRGGYVTPLLDWSWWRSRFYVFARYHRAINRESHTVLSLGNAAGIRGMEDNQVLGNQRLVGNIEYRLFPPWKVWGFHFMLLGFLDAGSITGEHDPLLQAKIYASTGLAVRIQNPDLVLPPLQLRVAFRNSIDDKGVLFAFRIGGPDSQEILVPGTQPGGFDFR